MNSSSGLHGSWANYSKYRILIGNIYSDSDVAEFIFRQFDIYDDPLELQGL